LGTVAPRGLVFQPFLDQSLQRPVRGRGYVVSLALHGLVALPIWLVWGQVETRDYPEPAEMQMAVSLLRQPDPIRAPGPVGPEAPGLAAERPREAGSWPSASRRARARAVPVVVMAPSPDSPVSAERFTGETEDERSGEPGALDRGADHGGAQAGGPGPGEGPAGGAGQAGGRPGGRRPIELFGRVVGGDRRGGMGPQGLPYAPLKESTELRTYDVFPPLPASQWTGDRPYLIVVDICVSGEGQVSDVALVKPASRILDPVVLEAVRTWRYRPRLVDGNARAFCHVVAIKYEQL